ncbi:MAG: hypothetical protein RBR97_19915 [Bacteroidales bacterium]|nr:hypothetical protein [Bacteroidales bacterium]
MAINKIRLCFQTHINNSKILYTYIGPKKGSDYRIFIKKVKNEPTTTGSYYEVLSNPGRVFNILEHTFNSEIELDIYISSNDIYCSVGIEEKLLSYIEKEKVNFPHVW